MTRFIDLTAAEAKEGFLRGSSYYNGDFPTYISFEPILQKVSAILKGGSCIAMRKSNPALDSRVNYSMIANKDGRFAWRPFELMHPAIYVSLVNELCEENNWEEVCARMQSFSSGVVECCSQPVVSENHESDKAAQIASWWKTLEQRSLTLSLDYSHVLNTDVTDCYGSIYTQSIPWALHGKDFAKKNKSDKKLLGNKIDFLIQSSRYGQTNGICQGSVLMDFLAELVLGYADLLITEDLADETEDFKILRYRDDYKIFANSDKCAERILKSVSDCLRMLGMRLGANKTSLVLNIVSGSIKKDKLEAIRLQDLGKTNAKTIQKQLLRIHDFGLKYPNSGALKRLLTEIFEVMAAEKLVPDDLDVQIAVVTDIGFTSPSCFPAVAAILSHLISLKPSSDKAASWDKVKSKMARVPHNGYLEIWLQRVVKPKDVGIDFASNEDICKIVNGEQIELWSNEWIGNADLVAALSSSAIVIADAAETPEKVDPEEIRLFKENAERFDS